MKITIKDIRAHDADRLANSLLQVTERLFKNPEIQAEFEQWQRERQQKGA